jgi:hypothetical protein
MISLTVEVLLRVRGIVYDEGATETVTVLGRCLLVRMVAESRKDLRTEMAVVPERS